MNLGLRIFITGGTFDKRYDEIQGKLTLWNDVRKIRDLGRSDTGSCAESVAFHTDRTTSFS